MKCQILEVKMLHFTNFNLPKLSVSAVTAHKVVYNM
jgi:hypothetical protein